MKLPFRSAQMRARILTGWLLASLLLTTVVSGQGTAPQTTATLSAAESKASARVRVETLREVTTALSDKAMEGRGTAQAGGERAAKYIADKFKQLGLKPLGDAGGYLQAVRFRSTEVSSETSLKVGDDSFMLGEDFVPAPPFTADKNPASAPLVIVGYGVTSEALKRDDLAGVDVKGKVVMVLRGQPKNVSAAQWAQEANLRAIAGNLIGHGVAGIIYANASTPQASYKEIADYLVRRNVALADAPAAPFKLPPIMLVSDAAANKMLAGTGTTLAELLAKAETGESVSREVSKAVAMEVTVKREQVTGSNVVGVLEGSDARLKSEAVVYTAHYDAFGITSSGKIYPGAADNALGVGELVSIAEAFTKSSPRPRRSMIFLAVTGEEYGLLGAEYWTKNPTWPLEKIAADLNFDGIGTEVYAPVKRIVGFGAEYSDLGPVMKEVLDATGMILTADPLPEEGVFYRSDHYAFVRKGVPSLMLLGGPEGETSKWIMRAQAWMATDYHQPGDIVRPDWNWDGARTVSVIGMLIGLRVANQEAMPRWLPSSPFNRARGAGEPPPSEKK
ncbi:MAG: M28 family peptidase [Acidobacteria bacterium]|nr:M28 family peptidase [Acidobacteriota bacterium]